MFSIKLDDFQLNSRILANQFWRCNFDVSIRFDITETIATSDLIGQNPLVNQSNSLYSWVQESCMPKYNRVQTLCNCIIIINWTRIQGVVHPYFIQSPVSFRMPIRSPSCHTPPAINVSMPPTGNNDRLVCSQKQVGSRNTTPTMGIY